MLSFIINTCKASEPLYKARAVFAHTMNSVKTFSHRGMRLKNQKEKD